MAAAHWNTAAPENLNRPAFMAALEGNTDFHAVTIIQNQHERRGANRRARQLHRNDQSASNQIANFSVSNPCAAIGATAICPGCSINRPLMPQLKPGPTCWLYSML